MKKNLILCATLAAIAFAGCNKDENNSLADGRTALQVTSGIQTRAHDKTWEANDAIGIYMLNGTTAEAANKQYTTATSGESGTFAPAATDQTIYFPVDGTTRDFVAYYPHTATIGADNLYPVNVTTQTPQKAIGLMAAAKVTGKSKTDPSVAFVFEHKLVKLDITIKGDGTSITDAELANTVVKITNQQTAGTYNVVDGGAVSVTSGSAAEITLLTTDLKAEGIVLPNGGTDTDLTLAAGTVYKYDITVNASELTVTSSIDNWTNVNEPAKEGTAEME